MSLLGMKELDMIRLKDGREATVLEILGDDEIIVDVGSSPKDWDTISVTIEEIESVIQH